MNKVFYLTEEGAENLKAELAELTGPGRLDIAKRLRIAIQQGDLSENADYKATKEEQGFLEGRIQEIEHILRYSELIREKVGKRDLVEIGAHITIQEAGEELETYHLVGPSEADPRGGKISHESPIGKALMGKKVNDRVSVPTPGGELILTILKIE